MTYDQYWYGDPLMVRAFYKAEQLRQQRIDEVAWLHGAYVLNAIEASVGNMFREKGKQPSKYPDKPISYHGEELSEEERESQDAAFALAYMTQMVAVGKNWGKKK